MSKIYIKTAAQISLQEPLSEAWIEAPLMTTEPYTRSQDPQFREWLNPMEARRMGKLMKRALVTAMKAMGDSGISQPDAIVTGTGLGCIENTLLFLDQICREGEEMLKPTNFMQSTHNTVSSLIAIHQKCHGYNTTYSHQAISFESALLDAFLQLRLGDIQTALVTGNDELTPEYFAVLQRSGYIGQPGQATASEASVAMMLTTDKTDALCEISEMKMHYGRTSMPALPGEVDAIIDGTSGLKDNDKVYEDLCQPLEGIPRVKYKHIFGEGYSASALGVYAAAHLLKRGEIPAMMRHDGSNEPLAVESLLFVNHSDGENLSYIILKKV